MADRGHSCTRASPRHGQAEYSELALRVSAAAVRLRRHSATGTTPVRASAFGAAVRAADAEDWPFSPGWSKVSGIGRVSQRVMGQAMTMARPTTLLTGTMPLCLSLWL